MKLLYWTAEWHGFAKLRMHTNMTIAHLEMLTREFGQLMRHFRDSTCSEFKTMELPHEVAARKQQHQCIKDQASKTRPLSASSSRKIKMLNLLTLKFHFLGDYASII
jgi:hypothetical protein